MTKMEKQKIFYTYKIESIETGMFYIGSHGCHSKGHYCRGSVCKYMGSGARLKRIKETYKHLTWRRHILGFHLSKREMSMAEIDLLDSNVNNPLCLNKIVTSPSRDPIYSEYALERMRDAVRSQSIEMLCPSGSLTDVDRDHIDQALLDGYVANQNAVQIMNHRTRQRALVSSKTVTIFWRLLKPLGWEYGYCTDYETINARQLTDSTGFKARYERVFSHLEPIES
jgi:hypothetical protein